MLSIIPVTRAAILPQISSVIREILIIGCIALLNNFTELGYQFLHCNIMLRLKRVNDKLP
jgi:hypothetical protein